MPKLLLRQIIFRVTLSTVSYPTAFLGTARPPFSRSAGPAVVALPSSLENKNNEHVHGPVTEIVFHSDTAGLQI